MQNIYRDGYDGQNIWIDFRDISLADQFPATVSTAGDRTIPPGTHYHSSIDYQNGRDFFRLQYTHEGMGRIVYRNPDGTRDIYDLGVEKCVFIPRIQNFEYFNPDDCCWNFIYINFRGEFAERVFTELLTKGPVHTFRKDSDCVAEFQNLLHLGLHRNLDSCDLKKITCGILTELQKACRQKDSSSEDDFQREAADWIQKHYREATVQGMAEHFGLTEKYFQAVFKKSCGMTPGQFLAAQRLNYVLRLLKCTNMKLSGIAEQAGFSDASHLCRRFRASTGITPEEFRQAPQKYINQRYCPEFCETHL